MKELDSLYIHFPYCMHLCNYCDFYKHKFVTDDQIGEFEDLLYRQIKFHDEFLFKNGFKLGDLDTLYVGGGTPSLWKKSGAKFLSNYFKLKSDYEFTIEVDPDTWTESEIDFWIDSGVNRFSIGSQAFSENYIKLMDRTHSLNDVEKTIKYFSERKLNYSVDLMLGLPKSEDRNILKELDGILKYEPNHFSVYILKTRKNYPHNKNLPNDEFIRDEYLSVSNYLQKSGYDHYEISNFSKNGFKSKHNQKYWDYKNVAALGPNATGLLVMEDKALRYQWKSASLGVTTEELKDSSLLIERLFLGLRTSKGFDFESIFTKEQMNSLSAVISSWKNEGYIVEDSTVNSVLLTPLGYLMCDSLIDDVFKHVDF